MEGQRFVTGDSKRIFVNTALGCNSSCSYCYLPAEGYRTGVPPEVNISLEAAINLIRSSGLYVQGRYGTIISIGCFSECWDSSNLQKTKGIISWALKNGNPVQMATKRVVFPNQVKDHCELIQWKGQYSIFLSSATISQWKEFERGTSNPFKRFYHIGDLISLGVVCYIYIKPVIEGVTLKDGLIYSDIANEKGCGVVIGSRFDDSVSDGVPAPIDSVSGLRMVASNEEDQLAEIFPPTIPVYWSSVDAINSWR
ncbi:hypothetical protein [Marinobacter xiaoshiensis]|uniref:4Fe-4S single cluster domain-containing protein n=1 Tax=Marinobacter xiaoshiensis TaxID=3073652 RepID=A0ABU2HK92_9GAMM|nr:hypothetical protein [Marinobacter sp. F60267]MDS1311492.1 hypothetical protein [Marinobacter sp. F60267]